MPDKQPKQSLWEQLPVITCAGNTPSEIGFSHGTQLRERIAAALDYYFHLFESVGLQLSTVRAWGEGYQSELYKFQPDLAAEIDGVANGAGRADWELHALNACSEIIAHAHQGAGRYLVEECTSVYCPASGLLAQRWHFDKQVRSLAVLLRIPRHGTTPLILTMTVPGILAQAGFNDCGVGVCLNFLPGPAPSSQPVGIPVHGLLRMALCCNNLPQAHALLKCVPRHCACHMLLADSIMQFRMLEYAGEALECAGEDPNARNIGMEDPVEGAEWQMIPPTAIFHTNHYLHPRLALLATKIMTQSQERYRRISEIIDEYDVAMESAPRSTKKSTRTSLPARELDLLKNVLGDWTSFAKPLSHDLAGAADSTGCSLIMDLRTLCIHIACEDLRDHNYTTVPLLSASL